MSVDLVAVVQTNAEGSERPCSHLELAGLGDAYFMYIDSAERRQR